MMPSRGLRTVAQIGVVLSVSFFSSCGSKIPEHPAQRDNCPEFRWTSPSAYRVSARTVTQQLSALEDPGRAMLFERSLEVPGTCELRRRLSSRYLAAGFPVAARFYETTVGFITSKERIVIPSPSGERCIQCAGSQQEMHGAELARKTYEEFLHAWPLSDGPLRSLDKELGAQPASCNVLRVWCSLVMSYGGLRNRLVSKEEEELAFALTLELGEDAGDVLIPPLSGPAGTYYEAASFFYLRGDMVSAYVAARFARQRLDCSGSGNITRESLLELLKPMLTARGAALEQIQDAGAGS